MGAPKLDFDWEVGAFRALRAFWRWVAPAEPTVDTGRVALLSDHQAALEKLGRLVSGAPVRVLPGRGGGGVRGLDVLLPTSMSLGPNPETNRALYALRTVHAATIAARRFVIPADPVERLRAELSAVCWATHRLGDELGAFEAAWREAAALALSDRPALHSLHGAPRLAEELHQRVLRGVRVAHEDASWAQLARLPGFSPPPPNGLWGALYPSELEGAPSDPGDVPAAPPSGTEVEAPPLADVRRVLRDAKANEEKVLQHTFEKVETVDSWQGNAGREDGADELDDELEALAEVDLREVVRGGPDAHAVLRADLGGGGIPDVETALPGELGVPYDEWDQGLGRYRRGWCTVYPTFVPLGRPVAAAESLLRNAKRVTALHRELLDLRARRAVIDRQLDGEHPDIDALVTHAADVQAGRSGDPRVYLRSVPRRRDAITTVLLDVSLSADAFVDGRRVLDVARDAVVVLGEVAERLGDRLQVLAFASSTRNRCRVFTVKGWREPWRSGAARLFALEPQGYTRIGAAIRHATASLRAEPAESRLLLVISDGKPTDYDRYEGAHGIHDVRTAIREAERQGVVPHALALDRGAASWLAPMFGAGNAEIVAHPDELVARLARAYGRLRAAGRA